MFNIKNTTDLRIAYFLLKNFSDGFNPTNVSSEFIISLKKAVRKYIHKKRNIISVYSGFDYVLTHEIIPHMFRTLEEAEEWFNEERRLPYYPSPYDCTGQPFTVRHKIFYTNGELHLYHLVRMDV